ncbi:cupin domain-containing protein [Stigmatella aurantiaca]|uniref:Cupin 4 family protein n=1 Tax=Stigmatella aurantiaca (strain DW4/3-1) TaxID=378806 RepID=Q091R3_STIAD|nr:cupin domain-containing protein [Stigmatella aurantiaca]ADO71930.1 Cupin 4 family protein [Stigmatella aurantiaca DW4/3-1]EAU66476.1 mina protein [Stigmatella aurantiaca DW4/3-1]
MSLARLLHPIAPSVFFEEAWERKPLVLQGPPDRWSGLFSSRDLGRLLTYQPPRSIEGMMLVKEGRHRDENWLSPDGSPRLEQVQAAWREGYTIVINKVGQFWEPVGRFCAAVEEELHHPVGVNLYMTPPGAQGFKAHFDIMDAFVLQVEGSKVWQVRGPQVTLPLPDEHTATSSESLPPVLLEQELKRGDVLYIPRGFVHEARTAQTHSVHLTLGLQAVTWSDLFVAAIAAARRDERFRKGLPPRFLEGSAMMEQTFRELLAELPRHLELGHALTQLAERLVVQKPPPPTEDLLEGAVELKGSTVLTRRPGMVLRVMEGPGYAGLQYSGGKLMGPAKIGPALRHIAKGSVIPVQSLPGLSEKEQLVLAGRLVRSGVLAVQETP